MRLSIAAPELEFSQRLLERLQTEVWRSNETDFIKNVAQADIMKALDSSIQEIANLLTASQSLISAIDQRISLHQSLQNEINTMLNSHLSVMAAQAPGRVDFSPQLETKPSQPERPSMVKRVNDSIKHRVAKARELVFGGNPYKKIMGVMLAGVVGWSAYNGTNMIMNYKPANEAEPVAQAVAGILGQQVTPRRAAPDQTRLIGEMSARASFQLATIELNPKFRDLDEVGTLKRLHEIEKNDHDETMGLREIRAASGQGLSFSSSAEILLHLSQAWGSSQSDNVRSALQVMAKYESIDDLNYRAHLTEILRLRAHFSSGYSYYKTLDTIFSHAKQNGVDSYQLLRSAQLMAASLSGNRTDSAYVASMAKIASQTGQNPEQLARALAPTLEQKFTEYRLGVILEALADSANPENIAKLVVATNEFATMMPSRPDQIAERIRMVK